VKASAKSSSNVAVSHRRTRSDHASETAEDYVEAIADIIAERSTCRVVDLASQFAVSHVTVSRILSRLVSVGLVETEPYQPVRLTAAGAKLAQQSRQRHETVYQFLIALGVSPKTAAIDTEGIEHHVSPETLRRFEAFTQQAKR
jgi:DtxR family transcriptional regulator, manganese transport regulator